MKVYIIYDERACAGGDTDDAAVLVSCESMKEAKSYKGDFGEMACYSYDLVNNEAINETWEWDYHG